MNTKVKNRKFIIGVDYNKMKLFDVEDSAQTLVDSNQQIPDQPVFDKTRFTDNSNKFKTLKVM